MHRIRTVFAALLVMVFCSAGSVGAQVISKADAGVWAQLLQMTDGRRLDTAIVRKALNSRVGQLRAAGALAIGQVGKPTGYGGLSILRSSLGDSDPGVASNAAYALGLLGDSGSVSELRALLAARPAVAINAAWALGAIGSPGRSAILSAIADRAIGNSVKVQVLLAAAKLRPVPVAELRPFLNSKNPSLAWAAAYSISRSRALPGARDMIVLASNPAIGGTCASCNPSTSSIPYSSDKLGMHRARAEVARMLVKNVAGDSLAGPAIAVLKKLIRDPAAHVRINAVRSLATYGAQVRAEVLATTRDPDANVRIAAAQVVGGVLDSAQSVWADLWSRDTSFMFRTSIASSAAALGVRPAQTSAWENSSDWRYRAALASELGSLPNGSVSSPVLHHLMVDRDARVRDAALNAFLPNDTLKLTPEMRAAAVHALSDDDITIRSTALGYLARNPNVAELDAVLASYERARRDKDSDARIAAAQYFVSLWKRDSLNFPAAARLRLAAMGAPIDPLERKAAGTSTLFSAWPQVLPATRLVSWYADVVNRLIVPAVRGKNPSLTITTVRGPIVLELLPVDAPLTVNNIMSLAGSGYYTGTRFHRVVPNFVAQDGDPTGTGSGGPGYAIRDEMNPNRYERGALGMALSGPDTGGSQYFITHSPQPHLDGGYTVFGRVLSGWNALDAIVQGDLIKSVAARR